MTPSRVAVIGGGLSGLAAAVELAGNGADVILLEQSDKLGGRCYSFRDPVTEDTVDNGQHVLIEAYASTLRYLDLIGATKYLVANRFTRLPFYHSSLGFLEFDLERILAAVPLPKGLLTSPLLKASDRLKLTGMALELRAEPSALEARLGKETVAQWLRRHGQSREACTGFWNPLAISIMNELPEKASASLFALSLKRAFLGDQADSTMIIPSVGQTELYVTPAITYLEEHGAKLHTRSEVAGLKVDGGRVVGVLLKDGETIDADAVISAVPQYAVARILPSVMSETEPFKRLEGMTSSPIVSVNLWFERSFMDGAFIGVIGRATQWLFNRSMILSERTRTAGHVSATMSAAYGIVDVTKETIVERVVSEIHEIYPPEMTGKLFHSSVIKEKRATFSSTNENEKLRLPAETALSNFYLAGDWTTTGLPATIEGAVQSGFRAAELALQKSGWSRSSS